ncbi:MAG: hypothetical protein FWF51_03730 [Chitinivibrionia bacterium]|nr:hypothetical protein [Chitinivibrionia bacterium]
MKLRIIVTLTHSIAMIWLFIVEVIRGEIGYSDDPTPNFTGDLIIISTGLFLFFAAVNFCLVCLSDALLSVLGKLRKKNYNIAYIRILTFTVLLLNIIVWVTGFHKYNINIVIIPIFICVILFIVYRFILYDNFKYEKTEIKSEKTDSPKNNFFTNIIRGFLTLIIFNIVISDSRLVGLFFIDKFFLGEFLVLSILFRFNPS